MCSVPFVCIVGDAGKRISIKSDVELMACPDPVIDSLSPAQSRKSIRKLRVLHSNSINRKNNEPSKERDAGKELDQHPKET